MGVFAIDRYPISSRNSATTARTGTRIPAAHDGAGVGSAGWQSRAAVRRRSRWQLDFLANRSCDGKTRAAAADSLQRRTPRRRRHMLDGRLARVPDLVKWAAGCSSSFALTRIQIRVGKASPGVTRGRRADTGGQRRGSRIRRGEATAVGVPWDGGGARQRSASRKRPLSPVAQSDPACNKTRQGRDRRSQRNGVK